MVTNQTNTNTIAFPNKVESELRKRYIDADQHTGIRLQLSNLLQTTLDLPQVLQLFFNELQRELSLASLSYQNDRLPHAINLGKTARHSCHYRLITSQDSLGELAFSRARRFDESELQLLEMLISCLICPVRNALMYRDAVQSALKDPLTGVGNRVAMESTLERDISLAHRHGQPLSVLVIDIDLFKQVNDSYGHSAGDCVLKDVAQQLVHCCRETDAAYRFGGEEFVVILNKTSYAGAAVAAERIRQCIADMTTTYQELSLNVTVSIGLASVATKDDMKSLFDRADEALYFAKRNGRNQVASAEARENSASLV